MENAVLMKNCHFAKVINLEFIDRYNTNLSFAKPWGLHNCLILHKFSLSYSSDDSE